MESSTFKDGKGKNGLIIINPHKIGHYIMLLIVVVSNGWPTRSKTISLLDLLIRFFLPNCTGREIKYRVKISIPQVVTLQIE